MLIIFGGLPGTGKTTLSRELARKLSAVHVRIDTIEHAIMNWGVTGQSIGEVGYLVGYAVAEDNLRLGRTVVADSVNPVRETRDAWRAVAERAGVPSVEVEVVCSDLDEHRRRVESRTTDRQVTWQDVLAREYQVWDREHVVIDTSGRSVEQSLAEICAALRAPIG